MEAEDQRRNKANGRQRMCKGLVSGLSAERKTGSTKWLMKVSQQLIDGEWPIEQSVSFDGSAFPIHYQDSATEVFLSSVERNGKLRSLRMNNVSLGMRLLPLFQRALVVNQELSSLELCNVKIVEAPLPESFFTIAGIKELSITRCNIKQDVATSVGQCIRSGRMKKLRLLNLNLEKECADGIMDAIPHGSLSHIELRDTRIDASIVAQMLQGLSKNQHLETLYLDHCGIDDQHVHALSAILAFPSSSLKTLSLKMNDLNGDCIRKLRTNGLQHNQMLSNLILSYNPIGDDGASQLSDFLISNTALKSLSMIECDIWEEGCRDFIAKLPKIKNLKQLIVDSEWECHDALLLEAMSQNFTLNQLWTTHSAMLMKRDPRWQQIGLLLRLNAAKRRILVESGVPHAAWPTVLAQSKDDASSLFHLLTHHPSVIH
mmetsp:Transcript_27856/g.67775  ORF Transcript_27856/g.67775 Transcript_27856/m.67775 type:complete len:431 (+) Transcript_27856:38-1330(+)|eukprot:CAMPEP_0113634452 /NCGR_PEP_ID=MMETSP0017_2-20120614/17942_1 /TAXON_ID=2856 /ORGANISM="Cylindrotheca closterium" /LENGTH=430 /DNA_ID=CAMNT_0000545157 /DNA_START=38 /DNA_END=1330 /DNA_ORIENTATION=- /assembly_acc=CAM_ASM_000147